MKDGAFTADRLLALYDRVAEAEDAIPRLRRFVLDLAVRGKLVEQDPSDEPAAELLKRITKEKARLVQAGEIAAFKSINVPSRGDLAFAIPSHWQPVFVANILNELQTGPFGSSLHQSDYRVGGTPVVNPASIQNERIVPIDKMAVGEDTLARLASFKLKSGDIVMARRGEMGRCAVVSESEAGWLCGTGSLILRPSSLLDARFLVLVIGSPFGRDYLGSSSVGATMQNLNQTILLNLPLGLPPLAEQQRIVAKVDELMALCDRLEGTRAGREAVRDRLTAATLARLTAPETDAETFPTPPFQTNVRFALQTLPTLTTRPDQIKTLRQTILNLAVRGKLVAQDPTDEPAAELLKRIAGSPAHQLPRRGKQRDTSAANALEELPFDAPEGWAFAALGQLVRVLNGRAYKQQELLSSGTPVLRVGNLFTSNHWYYSDLELDDDKYCEAGDLIYAWSASFGPFIWDGPRSIFHYHIWKLPLVSEADLSKRYLFLFLQQKTREIKEAGHGISMVHMTKEKMEKLIVPLPPLAEQQRIVAKVDALMALCDQLEASLTTATTTRSRLLEALLHEALDPAADAVTEAAE